MKSRLFIFAAFVSVFLLAAGSVLAEDADQSGRHSVSHSNASKHKKHNNKNSKKAKQSPPEESKEAVARDDLKASDGTSERTNTALYWIAGGLALIAVLRALGEVITLGFWLGISSGLLGYIFADNFVAFGAVGAFFGGILGVFWYFIRRYKARNYTQVVFASGPLGGSEASSAGNSPVPAINPTTGLPMGAGGVDAMGNAYGAPGVNPASGLPMAGGVDVGGNAYGTNNSF